MPKAFDGKATDAASYKFVVRVPDGASPGEVIGEIKINGKPYGSVTVPPGTKPGKRLKMQVPHPSGSRVSFDYAAAYAPPGQTPRGETKIKREDFDRLVRIMQEELQSGSSGGAMAAAALEAEFVRSGATVEGKDTGVPAEYAPNAVSLLGEDDSIDCGRADEDVTAMVEQTNLLGVEDNRSDSSELPLNSSPNKAAVERARAANKGRTSLRARVSVG
eukprot:CAMPEP_0119061126 /NCGR_PEP_ID=MMETSP1178-20130426/4967_1 /TAXON_ID=33656 /ORGANISM="unid sp, Strain CCMP2000" /LENGTH=217 /DNA_ID=CAMNT_0007042301 /DNA_START=32 /DNA_END=685 /DNA_ORIENTATION=-